MPETEQLLDSAYELSQEFYERADEIESARRLPPDVSEKLAQATFS